MNTNLYLVRHAHSVYTPDELNRPLSEKGYKDAKKVTILLSDKKITHVISSPYMRAIQTVEGIANLLGINITIEDGFRERKLAFGPVEDFNEVLLNYWMDFDFSLLGGESSNSAQQRGIITLKNILDKYTGGNIVIGTHGNIMVLMMNYFDKIYNYDFWCNLKMPDIYKLSFDNKNLIEVKQIWT